jgi:hypothetical protein
MRNFTTLYACYAREFHLDIKQALFAGAEFPFRALAVGEIAAHLPDTHRPPGLSARSPLNKSIRLNKPP